MCDEILVLSHNKIAEIDITTLGQLVKLQLSHNRLKAFPDIRVWFSLLNYVVKYSD